MKEILEDYFSKKTLKEWTDIFDQSDACVAPVLSPMQSKNNPHIKHRNIWVDSDGLIQAAPAPRFDDSANENIGRIPKRDEHKKEILSELSEDKF